MNPGMVFYVIIFLISFSAIYLSYNLNRKYNFDFLRNIHLFTIVSVIFAFFNWIGPELAGDILKNSPELSSATIIILLKTLGYPFLIFKLYLLFSLTRNYSTNDIKPRTKYIFISLLLIMTILHPAISIQAFNEKLTGFSYFYKRIEGHTLVTIQYILIFALIRNTLHYTRNNIKYSGKLFGLWYLGGFTTAVTVMSFKSGLLLGFYISVFLFFVIIIPPLIAIKLHLSSNKSSTHKTDKSKFVMQNFCSEFSLNQRETEILTLILQNKTNKEIEDSLFISMQTVKNNISAIYRKTDVKNRQHLYRKFNSYLDS